MISRHDFLMIKLQHGDCLELMQSLPDNSIDMILCDLPYGTSGLTSKWDKILPLDKLWIQYRRLIKDTGAIVLFAVQPFTSQLILSNLEMYKYNWVWKKDNGTNFLNSHYQPMKITEDICVFSKAPASFSKNTNMNYFPQMTERAKPYKTTNNAERTQNAVIRSIIRNVETVSTGTRMPTNILEFKRDKEKIHPTQKPVALLEYLIKTYTKENDLVLDNCAGSFSTGIACVNTNRSFIGMEKDENYFEKGKERFSKQVM